MHTKKQKPVWPSAWKQRIIIAIARTLGVHVEIGHTVER